MPPAGRWPLSGRHAGGGLGLGGQRGGHVGLRASRRRRATHAKRSCAAVGEARRALHEHLEAMRPDSPTPDRPRAVDAAAQLARQVLDRWRRQQEPHTSSCTGRPWSGWWPWAAEVSDGLAGADDLTGLTPLDVEASLTARSALSPRGRTPRSGNSRARGSASGVSRFGPIASATTWSASRCTSIGSATGGRSPGADAPSGRRREGPRHQREPVRNVHPHVLLPQDPARDSACAGRDLLLPAAGARGARARARQGLVRSGTARQHAKSGRSGRASRLTHEDGSQMPPQPGRPGRC